MCWICQCLRQCGLFKRLHILDWAQWLLQNVMFAWKKKSLSGTTTKARHSRRNCGVCLTSRQDSCCGGALNPSVQLLQPTQLLKSILISLQWHRNRGSDSQVHLVFEEISMEALQPYQSFSWKYIAPPKSSSWLQEKAMVEAVLLLVEQRNLHWVMLLGASLVPLFNSALINISIHLRS